MVNQPKLLTGDEPTGNLDTKRSGEVLAMLRQLKRDRGQTIILVTLIPRSAQPPTASSGS